MNTSTAAPAASPTPPMAAGAAAYSAMTKAGSEALAQVVLDVVNLALNPLSAAEVVECVQAVSPVIRAVDIKIVALNLVSQGLLHMNDAWQLEPARDSVSLLD